jgi:hypothetical protein
MDRKSRIRDASTEISEIDNLFENGICGKNLCLTRAERGTFLGENGVWQRRWRVIRAGT